MINSKKLQVAIIGAGPAGLFAAHELASRGIGVALFNRDIKPGGLAEYGIFPDKRKMKEGLRCQFRQILECDDVAYFGNVTIGLDGCIRITDLLEWGFKAVLVTCGAQGTKQFNLPGENLKGVYSAKDVVYHYNQLPPFSTRSFPVGKKVAVVGGGNVMTDIVHYLIICCGVEQITVIVRRGPGEVKFNKKEMLPIIGYLNFEDFDSEFTRISSQMQAIGQNPDELKNHILSALEKACPKEYKVDLRMRFLYSPSQIIGDAENSVSGLLLQENTLEVRDDKVLATGCGVFHQLDVDSVIFAIGDRVTDDLGLPMDRGGILISPKPKYPVEEISYEVGDPKKDKSLNGVFVAGWSRNASKGLVGIAHKDGVNAANAIAQYIGDLKTDPGIEEKDIQRQLRLNNCKYILKEKLFKLEVVEKKRAKKLGLEEFKFITNEEMLKAMG